jgi:hypothetical protein
VCPAEKYHYKGHCEQEEAVQQQQKVLNRAKKMKRCEWDSRIERAM